MMFRAALGKDGPIELAQPVEKAKTKAGKLILKKTEERFPPFYGESYDRIVRDEVELEERMIEITGSPEDLDLCGDSSDYETLYVAHSSN